MAELFTGNFRKYLPVTEEPDVYEHRPEKNLISAVLRRGLFDLCDRTPKHIRKQAHNWIFYGLPASVPFSFKWCCMYLDLCPHTLRRAIIAMPKEMFDENIHSAPRQRAA